MSLYEARFGVAVPYPQVSSLYEALTWGFIHLRLSEPLAPSALALRALSRTPHVASLHCAAIPTATCRDVPWHVRLRRRCETIDSVGVVGDASPGGRPLSNPQWNFPLGVIVQ